MASSGASPWNLNELAGLWPDRPGLVDTDRNHSFTYAELADRASRLATGLSLLGVKRGDRVAGLLANGVPAVDLLFACATLGATLVPLNWRLSMREIEAIAADIDAGLVVASDEHVDMARAALKGLPLVSFSGSPSFDDLLASPLCSPPERAGMDDPLLILYTGGTTGTPKGAILTHGSMAWNAINTSVSWGLTFSDIGPVFTPTFHTGFWNVFTLPLMLMGGCVLLPSRFDPGDCLSVVERFRPTIFFLVPTMFQLVAEHPDFDQTDFSSLRWAISGGAPLPEPVYERWRSKVSVFKQGYGLTEVGPNNFATPDATAGTKPGTVGRQTLFARTRIVDDDGRNLPDGVPGELLLAGPHMCAGYWNRPEATAETIRDGWFHTGDVAKRDADGYFYIVDRKKDMIITGGENVYPAEVEAVLYAHPAVREAAVIGMPDPTWGEAVTAVVSLNEAVVATVEELRQFTRDRLAHYKCPKSFVILDDLPKSGANKISRTEAKKWLVERANTSGAVL